MTRSDIVSLIVEADGTYAYQMFFDGSDVGLTTTAENVAAFAFLADGSIVLATTGAFSVPSGTGGTLTGGGQDLLRFVPSSMGGATAGTWSIFFDGSDVGPPCGHRFRSHGDYSWGRTERPALQST